VEKKGAYYEMEVVAIVAVVRIQLRVRSRDPIWPSVSVERAMAEGGCSLGVGASVRGRAREGERSCGVDLVVVQVPRLVVNSNVIRI
jgi:hypothetical protein